MKSQSKCYGTAGNPESRPMPIDQSTIAFAHKLADAAGAVIRPYFRRKIDIVDKGDGFFDPVTAADKGAEQAIRAIIKCERPEDGILGEEYGEEKGTNAWRWVLDPVDGTRAFIAGQPMWGTLIALEENGRPVLGVLDQPFLKERFIGHDGQAFLVDGAGTRPLAVRRCERLAEAVVCTTHPFAHLDDEDRARFRRVELAARLSRYGGDCYAYGLVAMGFIDLVIEASLKRWDIAAIVPIIEGAGGIITDWEGRPWRDAGPAMAAGDRRVHAEALKLLAG